MRGALNSRNRIGEIGEPCGIPVGARGKGWGYAEPTGHCEWDTKGFYLLSSTTDSKSISQSYGYCTKPYCGLLSVEYLAERARSARYVSRSLSVTKK
jgi:hypothetical protein